MLPFLGSLCAVITDHMARAEIRRAPQQLEGDGLAVGGLVLGWLSVVFRLIGFSMFVLFLGGFAWLGQANR